MVNETVSADPPLDSSERARARLGAFDIGCVVVGGIIGVGIFFTPQRVAAVVDHGGQVILAWALGGVLAILGALVFAWLGRRVVGDGGMFQYIFRAFGPLPAFIYGWANWLVIQAGALGVIGLVMAQYLDRAISATGRETFGFGARVGIAVGAILFFTLVNVLGLRAGRRMQNVLTVTKVLAVLALIVVALFSDGGARLPEVSAARAPVGWPAAMAAAMLPVLFSFGGWQQGSFVAGAARVPERDVPLGIIAGVLVVVVAYLSVNLALIDVLGFDRAAREPAIADAAVRTVLRPYGYDELGGRVISWAVVISSLGILNTICLAPPFVLHAMARRGLFPAAVGRLDPRFGTPTLGVLIQGVWGAALLVLAWLLLGSDAGEILSGLLNGVVFVDWVFFALCGCAAWKLSAAETVGSGFWQPIRWVSALFALAAVTVAVGAVATDWKASMVGAGVCVLGLPLYGASRSRER